MTRVDVRCFYLKRYDLNGIIGQRINYWQPDNQAKKGDSQIS